MADRDIALELAEAASADFDELMRWFPDAAATRNWGGPNFRFPFTAATFREDCRWPAMASFVARIPGETRPLAFGQFYELDGRINFARLVVHPEQRGRGIGRRFVRLLAGTAAERLGLEEASLFVYRDNEAAVRCYRSLGFAEAPYPPDRPLADECYYLTRAVGSPRDW